MNKDQVIGLIERGVTVLVTYALARGWIDAKIATDLGPLLVGIGSLVYAVWINRPKALIQSAAAVPGTVVVTQPEIAHATPETNVVSSATNSVRRNVE